MTKKDIVRIIAEKVDLPQFKVKEVVQMTFDSVVQTLTEEGRIELRNFGVFEVRFRKPRRARNPRTGVKVNAPGKNVISFKPGKTMEDKAQTFKAEQE